MERTIQSFKFGHLTHLWTAASNGPTLHPPDDILVRRAKVEHWQWKTKEPGEERVAVPFYPQITDGLTWAQTQASVVSGLTP
jgi:hypothetical protein